MTTKYRVRFLPEATAALREAASYIAEQDGRDRAAEWLRGMYDSIEALEVTLGAFARVQVRAGRVVIKFCGLGGSFWPASTPFSRCLFSRRLTTASTSTPTVA